ncbi:MAG: MerR family transcriptional regulator [Acidobacteriia bacterium]|jgi:DNA-binding transcriptional MerR regulator|nr:MerR family transcriptional regulator [Terriglobia bacterium]
MVPTNDSAALGGEEFQPAQIPDKLFFKIGEVSNLVGVEAYVLRYWESEFRGLSPKKSSTGQRMFRRKDVELLLEIKHLLYDRKFTIEGARKSLADKSSKPAVKAAPKKVKQESLFGSDDPIPEIRRQLAEILKLMA